MKETISKKMKEAGILLIATVMVLSTVAVSADTMDKLENDCNYINSSSSQNMDNGDSLFLQLPHDPDESWSMATTDTGSGYIMYENFWDITEPIGDIHWWGLALKYTPGGWRAGNPNNLVFDIKFYADDPDDHTLPDELVATFTNIVPPVITGTGQYYNGFEMYYFDGVELEPFVNLSEGWVSIYSKSGGMGEDWLLWASAKTGDGFSYQDGNSPPGRSFDQAMNLTGVGNLPPEKPQRPSGPTEGVVGVEYTFCTSTTDPEGENVYYLWDWGDNTPIDWLGPFNSGATACASHIWTEADEYEITVKARDPHEKESEWKVSTVIRNTGGVDATKVNWSITFVGGFMLLGEETTGNILILPAGDEKTVSSSLILGFGKTVITAAATCDEGASDTNTRDAFVLLFFIF